MLRNNGLIVGCQRSFGKSFAMQQEATLQVGPSGIIGDRIFGVFFRPQDDQSDEALKVITFRDPKYSKLVLLRVEKTPTGEYDFIFPSGNEMRVQVDHCAGKRYNVEIWDKQGGGIEVAPELSKQMSRYLKVDCVVLMINYEQVRHTSGKYLPGINPEKEGQLQFQDGAQLTFISQEEILRFNQVLAMHGKECITTFPWWRMNVMLYGIDDLYSVKILRIRNLLVELTHPCQRCPGMNVVPYTGVKQAEGPETWLKQYGWIGSTLFPENKYLDDHFNPYQGRKGKKAHHPFFGMNGIIINKLEEPRVNYLISVNNMVEVVERYNISL